MTWQQLQTETDLNRKRRARAASALRAHQGGRLDGGISLQEIVTDLIADIMHLRDGEAQKATELHMESAFFNAKRLYKRERADEANERREGIKPTQSTAACGRLDPEGGAQ